MAKVMRISRQPSPILSMIIKDSRRLCGIFQLLGSMTNDTQCTREIKARINMEKATVNKTKTRFISKLDLNLTKKVVKGCIWSIALYGTENLMFYKQIGNNWKVSECCAGEGWRNHWD
jgi:hypothetical protein